MKYLVLIFTVLLCSSASANDKSIQYLDQQWDLKTKLALAQCLVAETGWGLEVEKTIIAHVLVKRWVRINGYKTKSLLHTIQAYCAIHHRFDNETPRRLWIKGLRWSVTSARGCEEYDHRGDSSCMAEWQSVMSFVDRFTTGTVQDPLPLAEHYGNAEDHRKRVKKGLLGRVRLLPRWLKYAGSVIRLENYFYAMPR